MLWAGDPGGGGTVIAAATEISLYCSGLKVIIGSLCFVIPAYCCGRAKRGIYSVSWSLLKSDMNMCTSRHPELSPLLLLSCKMK